jgi:hypothetical protein
MTRAKREEKKDRNSSSGPVPEVLPEEVVEVSSLRPHPRNYKSHPEEQLAHIDASLREFGVYRNVVVSKDGVVLAGHGVVESAKRTGVRKIPVRRVPFDSGSPQAEKVIVLDNELGRFAETDDRLLSEILKVVRNGDPVGLLGTGYDDQKLAALLMVTRPASEIASFDEAAEWAGMPEYVPGHDGSVIVNIHCTTKAMRDELVEKIRSLVTLGNMQVNRGVVVAWYPPRENNDTSAVTWSEKKARKGAKKVG